MKEVFFYHHWNRTPVGFQWLHIQTVISLSFVNTQIKYGFPEEKMFLILKKKQTPYSDLKPPSALCSSSHIQDYARIWRTSPGPLRLLYDLPQRRWHQSHWNAMSLTSCCISRVDSLCAGRILLHRCTRHPKKHVIIWLKCYSLFNSLSDRRMNFLLSSI